ncbi:MAG: CTP synthase [Christensenellales bacterium]|jgi:CTP synthase
MANNERQTKYIFVTGGVVSGLGKGITAASLGRLLKERGLKVIAQKFDPYINIDPGLMSPLQHGEVFVTEDGAESDLDLGHYERFIDENINKYSCMTTGKVYTTVLANERKGEYMGNTIQVVPHITNEIKRNMYRVGETAHADIVISEIGGTVGDIESLPYLESMRQIRAELGFRNVLYIHVTLVPYLEFSGEHKSKPTQHSVKELLSLGIQPNIIVCRADRKLERSLLDKVAMFCSVHKDCVIQNSTLSILYEAPLMLEESNFSDIVLRELNMEAPKADLSEWRAMVQRIKNLKDCVKIALVGKYVSLHDAYLSVLEALKHGGYENDVKIEVDWVDSELLDESNIHDTLKDADGIIVPGGYGERGTEGMILAAKYAREKDIPYFGIGFGMQMAIIEFARNVLELKDAGSGEFSKKSAHKVIDVMPEHVNVTHKGASVRLGKYPCDVTEGTILQKAYNSLFIEERHRHNYEVNNDYREQLEKAGMKVSGQSPSGDLIEAIELPPLKWFVGVLFHPEFKSRPNRAHPLFRDFIRAVKEYKEEKHGKI